MNSEENAYFHAQGLKDAKEAIEEETRQIEAQRRIQIAADRKERDDARRVDARK